MLCVFYMERHRELQPPLGLVFPPVASLPFAVVRYIHWTKRKGEARHIQVISGFFFNVPSVDRIFSAQAASSVPSDDALLQ